MDKTIDDLVNKSLIGANSHRWPTYRNKVSDLRHCSICDKPIEMQVTLMDESRLVGCMCDCEVQEVKQEQERDRQKAIEAYIKSLRTNGITDPNYLESKFENDDSPDSANSVICRRYAKSFDKMSENGIGMILHGPVGTGKSFYACCIANELIDSAVPCLVTSLPRILNQIFTAQDKQAVIDRMQDYELLVIDDFGTERASEYTMEQIFNVIDSRSRSGKPLIVTTNLTIDSMRKPADINLQRIYDRVLEMTPISLSLTGKSRRIASTDNRREEAIQLLMKE